MIEERQISVGELKALYDSGLYNIELDTPDGYQPIGQWFDKGPLPMVTVTTKSYSTTCAENHMIQLESKTGC